METNLSADAPHVHIKLTRFDGKTLAASLPPVNPDGPIFNQLKSGIIFKQPLYLRTEEETLWVRPATFSRVDISWDSGAEVELRRRSVAQYREIGEGEDHVHYDLAYGHARSVLEIEVLGAGVINIAADYPEPSALEQRSYMRHLLDLEFLCFETETGYGLINFEHVTSVRITPTLESVPSGAWHGSLEN